MCVCVYMYIYVYMYTHHMYIIERDSKGALRHGLHRVHGLRNPDDRLQQRRPDGVREAGAGTIIILLLLLLLLLLLQIIILII